MKIEARVIRALLSKIDRANLPSSAIGRAAVRGQRQRIANRPSLPERCTLPSADEATSALDGESEEAIQEALAKLMRGRTVIAIAYRLSTIHNWDRIIVLRDGQLIQDGPPDHLMRHEGIYRNLVLRGMNRLAKQAA